MPEHLNAALVYALNLRRFQHFPDKLIRLNVSIMLTGEDEGERYDFPTVSLPQLGAPGTCLIYSGSFVGLDLECQPELPYSLDISSQLADQRSDFTGQWKDKISNESFLNVCTNLS